MREGWVVALADMPWIRSGHDRAGRRARSRSGAALAAPFHRGRRGHPVGFGKACGPSSPRCGGDEGAKSVVAAHASAMLRIDVDDPGVLRDVDTPQDLGVGER